ncbi:tRNA pseudouridine(38-40) synthase TruA [Geothermobacter hydrogeniphilus]|uniref:tRNA pseudouridine synthase A n=1 Tax=Geothermobacter hydrogeniphilus TaxID=1969733 RepID=A0A1X0Y306_9BACT|nr:tRNA pseudouridine(38-40) synthase TruA [Geothermobacter hydrogeniphilus]ORJ59509.1 tRNA pseudouridine(38-40) synthase TruA [Geothermobacter hydrogeniphilus]
MRIRLLLEYDGTDFCGWQVQARGRTVQGTVEEALRQILGEEVRLHSSGRTDAGVHARGMVAHFDPPRELPLRAWREGLNALLPDDLAVREAAEVAADFHARFSARGKWYRYSLLPSPCRRPLLGRTSWQIRSELDLPAMVTAAADFVGEHDFSAFRAAGCAARTTVRRIDSIDLVREGELLHWDIRGSGFLKNMIRIMLGTLVEIGLGNRPTTDVRELLAGCERSRAGRTAPPQGLCLQEVYY